MGREERREMRAEKQQHGRGGTVRLSKGEPGHLRWKTTGPVKWERVKKQGPRTYSANMKVSEGRSDGKGRHDPTAYHKHSGPQRPDTRLRRPGGPKPSSGKRMKRYLRRQQRNYLRTKEGQEQKSLLKSIRASARRAVEASLAVTEPSQEPS